jgi:hypothetical protein
MEELPNENVYQCLENYHEISEQVDSWISEQVDTQFLDHEFSEQMDSWSLEDGFLEQMNSRRLEPGDVYQGSEDYHKIMEWMLSWKFGHEEHHELIPDTPDNMIDDISLVEFMKYWGESVVNLSYNDILQMSVWMIDPEMFNHFYDMADNKPSEITMDTFMRETYNDFPEMMSFLFGYSLYTDT